MEGLFMPPESRTHHHLDHPLTSNVDDHHHHPFAVQPPRFAACCWPFSAGTSAAPCISPPRMGHIPSYEDPLLGQVPAVYSDDSGELEPSHLPLFQPHHHRGGVSCAKKYARKKPMTQMELDRKRVMANRQERRRMHRLNSALERLRQAIPAQFQQQPPRRLSKIKTLRMAINYISALDSALKESDLCWTTGSKNY